MEEWITKLTDPERIFTFVRAIMLLVFGLPGVFMFSRWLRKRMTRTYTLQQAMIVSKVVGYGLAALVIITVMVQLDFKLAPLLGAAGILGIAAGFASQTSVSNIISGVFLMAERPFVIGDIVTVGSHTGIVLSIDLLSVKMRKFDNTFVRMPNETIIKSDLVNITRHPLRRCDIDVGVAYKEDIGRVREILLAIAEENPHVLDDPAPLFLVKGFGSSSVDILLGLWVEKTQWLTVKNSMIQRIHQRFAEEGIEIPFPHMTLYTGEATKPFPIDWTNPEVTRTAEAVAAGEPEAGGELEQPVEKKEPAASDPSKELNEKLDSDQELYDK